MGTSLMVQWLRIHLPMQRTWVRSLVWESSTCCGATEAAYLEPTFCNKKRHHSEMGVMASTYEFDVGGTRFSS